MSQDKKFGTFGGVFTPSILTILGVIMYMRLPWIVGQAGIFLTIGIVVVAHIVSISTGLSVSSIATDKKVKAGGTYFIISRSLGLPIGGTLGIALFFGLSLSVSLYIIGFSESFLGFWDLPVTKDSIRLTGTIAILCVGTLTFISTSLAIKTQYFIMAAIGLSLLSILFGKTDFVPAEPLLHPIETMSPLIFLFAIFFPAVTGFEAGVSMSGDLKDPKKSIPVGTISAILVGVTAYIGLTIFFGFRVNSNDLINNPNILLEMSIFAPLVVAGIWGATLSSAIGSILGAPRILQATSTDRITPQMFSKGYGKTNEPRNALILTFIVAEAGILIGELNLIARVVSMFFITTYGFLNLSSALENWASTDFRPSFKIPAWISILGAIVCFILMLELDFVALIGATIIMGAIFLYLKRKELSLESGDTWEGVWASILRSGLNRLSRTVKQQRNWRPNIILFSGDGTTRPYLLEFGRWLVHKRGILSNFNLIENKSATHLMPQPLKRSDADQDEFQGIFMRHVEVNNIYEGMDAITKVYGFAGLEPNTVMLGWGRNSKQPEHFGRLILNYAQLDYNIFIMDFDRERGFGDMQTIDLWWRGGSNNVTLALTLLKFLQASPEWDAAKARIFIVSDDSALHNKIYKNMTAVLEEQRIDAALKIINNAIEHKPIPEIIRIESMNSDLTIIGLPEPDASRVEHFVSQTDELIDDLGTVLLIRASSFFKPIYIGIERQAQREKEEITSEAIGEIHLPEIELPAHDVLADSMKQINSRMEEIFRVYKESYLDGIYQACTGFVENIASLINKSLDEADEARLQKEAHRSRKAITRVQANFLFNLRRIVQQYKTDILPGQKENLSSGLERLMSDMDELQEDTPQDLTVYYDKKEMAEKKLHLSVRDKLSGKNKPIRRKLRLQTLLRYARKVIERKVVYEHLREFGISSYQLISELQKIFNTMNDSILAFESAILKGEFNTAVFETEKKKITGRLDEIMHAHQSGYRKMMSDLFMGLNHSMQSMAKDLDSLQVNRLLKKKLKIARKQGSLLEKIQDIPESWLTNQILISNFFIEDLHLKGNLNRIETILERMLADISLKVETNYTARLEELNRTLTAIGPGFGEKLSWLLTDDDILDSQQLFNTLITDIQNALDELPEDLEVMAEESFQKIEQEQYNEVATVTVNLQRYIEFLVETEVVEPLQRHITELMTQLRKTDEVAQDVVRFINYNLHTIGGTDDIAQDSLKGVLKSSLDRLKGKQSDVEELQNKLNVFVNRQIKSVFEKMNPVLVSRAVGELKHTIRTKEGQKYLTKLRSVNERVKTIWKNMLVRLVYKRSEGVLFAKKLGQTADAYQTETGRVLESIKDLIPDSMIQGALPYYYRQLFLGKRLLSKEFLIERPSELEQALQTLYLYRQGYHGALLIIGERLSGKSTLSNMVASTFFEKSNISHIFPPDGGSTDPSEFKRRISDALQNDGNYEDQFNALPVNSVLIFHDMELWWQRSPDGFIVIDELTMLINKFGSKCFFIVNCGVHSFSFINSIKSINDSFIRAIECQPFDAEDIQNSILLRHQSSGLKFRLSQTHEERLSNFRLARLFNAYFDISGGNIGYALHSWISNIQRVKQDIIEIRPPVRVSENALTDLNKEWIIWLQQFLLHKHLTLERLPRITGMPEKTIAEMIHNLKRSGLIYEEHPGVLSILPYIQPILVKRFNEMDIL